MRINVDGQDVEGFGGLSRHVRSFHAVGLICAGEQVRLQAGYKPGEASGYSLSETSLHRSWRHEIHAACRNALRFAPTQIRFVLSGQPVRRSEEIPAFPSKWTLGQFDGRCGENE